MRGIHLEKGSSSCLPTYSGISWGKRGAEDLGLVVFEALDFGLHVFKAGLFGGEGGFVCLGDVRFDWRGRFGLSGGRFWFARCVAWQAHGL